MASPDDCPFTLRPLPNSDTMLAAPMACRNEPHCEMYTRPLPVWRTPPLALIRWFVYVRNLSSYLHDAQCSTARHISNDIELWRLSLIHI